jgi:hypothetical protein
MRVLRTVFCLLGAGGMHLMSCGPPPQPKEAGGMSVNPQRGRCDWWDTTRPGASCSQGAVGSRPAVAWETDSSATHPVLAPPMPCRMHYDVAALLADWVGGQGGVRQRAALRSARIHAPPLPGHAPTRRHRRPYVHSMLWRGASSTCSSSGARSIGSSRFRLEEGVRGPRVTAPSRGASATRPWASAASMRCPPQIGCRCARSCRRMGSDPHAHTSSGGAV